MPDLIPPVGMAKNEAMAYFLPATNSPLDNLENGLDMSVAKSKVEITQDTRRITKTLTEIISEKAKNPNPKTSTFNILV